MATGCCAVIRRESHKLTRDPAQELPTIAWNPRSICLDDDPKAFATSGKSYPVLS